jgi:hypothetical protein
MSDDRGDTNDDGGNDEPETYGFWPKLHEPYGNRTYIDEREIIVIEEEE